MKKKVSEIIADFMVKKGVKHVFTITGGGAMHLNDALGHKEGLQCIYNHHEQACSMAAEAYARLTGKIALVCVTSGPGGTNAITGVLGGWQDSIPMFIVSGQVKRITTTQYTGQPLRQLGDQEYQITEAVSNMTKYAVMLTNPLEILFHLEKAWFLANEGRKGPVWLDIPLDVQASLVEEEELVHFNEEAANKRNSTQLERDVCNVSELLRNAKRPVILAGTGIRLGNAQEEFERFINVMQIPVVTAWNAHDLLQEGHSLDCGRPGTVGTRSGNMVLQSADVILVLASRLNIRMISYQWECFGKDAKLIAVDIDEKELCKPTVQIDVPIHADIKDFLKEMIFQNEKKDKIDFSAWLSRCKEVNERYPAVLNSYYNSTKLNPYVFIKELFRTSQEEDRIICGNGAACVITFQAAQIKKGQRLFTNSGCAAMGYGFPASIGVCIAEGKRTICVDGDGSFQMNLQELQTVVCNNLDIKIVILNNNGYHSIRQTQKNLFKGRPLVGVCEGNGVSFPKFERLAYAYEIPYCRIESVDDCKEKLNEALNTNGPILIEAVVDENQNFEPKLSSKVMPDGTIVSPPIDDMYPFLPREEYEEVKSFLKDEFR